MKYKIYCIDKYCPIIHILLFLNECNEKIPFNVITASKGQYKNGKLVSLFIKFLNNI